jgi:hypothetical protein
LERPFQLKISGEDAAAFSKESFARKFSAHKKIVAGQPSNRNALCLASLFPVAC